MKGGVGDAVEFAASREDFRTAAVCLTITGYLRPLTRDEAIQHIKDSIEKSYGMKGQALVDKNFAAVISGMWPDPADNEANTAWVRDYYGAIHPHSGSEGGYINFMADDDSGRVSDNYGPNYQRLRDVKRNWDPDNVFHLNQKIMDISTRLLPHRSKHLFNREFHGIEISGRGNGYAEQGPFRNPLDTVFIGNNIKAGLH